MKKYLIVLASGLLFASTAALADPPQGRGQGGQHSEKQHKDNGKHDKRVSYDYRDNRQYRNDRDDRSDRRDDRRDRDDRHDRHDRHDRDDRYQYDRGRYVRDDRGLRDHDGRYYVVHDRGRHEGWYKRGGYLPVQYRESRYYVTDWRALRLREPPRGYRWVRSDNNDFLLVAIATGIITSIILSN